MNDHTLRVLEFDKVMAIVAGYAVSGPGCEAVRRMLPARDRQTVTNLLEETREFTRILDGGETPPLDGIPDVGKAIEKLGAAGAVLTSVELLNTAAVLAAGRQVKKFFQRIEGGGPVSRPLAPLLCSIAAVIRPLQQIEEAVRGAIDDRAEVRDSASPELRKIRKRIARTRDDILSRMSGMLQDSGYQKVIQEPVITIRDDRYVLPLKPNFRQNLNGVVHGQSGSRATLFVEPLEVLEQNNRLAELRMEEREEVERVLRGLTALLGAEVTAVLATTRALSAIDAIYARARFGQELGGTVPGLTPERRVRLRQARHPLLVWKQKRTGGRDVSPNDLELGSDERALIVSGPNAGGKTVVLKTVGLLTLMAQAGLPVTAAEGSELPCFGSIFADIGDEQSIEQDMSTFSSHAAHIAEILREANADSLVLLDELGSGTDPAEGVGLGAAVLESLIARGSVTLVTTHHNGLKLFGAEGRGAVNAAMEFDPETLLPTYRLIPGRPGRSYGLDMAARIGVPDEVIREARAWISEDDTRLESLLKQVEAGSRRVAEDHAAIEQELSSVRRLRDETETALKAAREEAREIRAKAKAETKATVEALRQKIRELSRTAVTGRAEIRKQAAEIESLAGKLEPAMEQDPDVMPDPGLNPGDRVRIPRWNRSATVLASRQGLLELDVDGKKLKLSAREVMPLEPLPLKRQAATTPGWGADLQDPDGPSNRLNIIGLRVEDALSELERFIDRAGVSGLSSVTIIHGLGTGALKTAVVNYLRNHALVEATRSGEPAEGGAGVTVAELKT